MRKERVLYPCYFKASLTRRQGRRVPVSDAVEHPTTREIAKALNKLNIECRVEEAHHPGHWLSREGRVIAMLDVKKEELIHKVAQALKGKK
jgi:signal recognition particle subunit SRP19